MNLLKQPAKIRSFRICSSILSPLSYVIENGNVVLQFFSAFSAILISILNWRNSFPNWFPNPDTNIFCLIIISLLFASILTIPAIEKNKHVKKQQDGFGRVYTEYINNLLEEKLNIIIKDIENTFNLSELTASIMVPKGSEILLKARRLFIIAFSRNLKFLPSRIISFDWDDGVAGKIWKYAMKPKQSGLKEGVITVKNSQEYFDIHNIHFKELPKSGSYGHKVGVCFAIDSTEEIKAKFLGVLSIGSNSEEDFEVFESIDFLRAVKKKIDTVIVDHLKAYYLTGNFRRFYLI